MSDGWEGWASRLRRGRFQDGNGSLSVLTHYCRILRLLSGLRNTPLLNLTDGLVELRSESRRTVALRSEPRVVEFLSWLGGLEWTDRNTVWAMIAQDLFPGVPRAQSVFALLGGTRSVSEATDEMVRSTFPSLEILEAVLGDQVADVQDQGVLPDWPVIEQEEVMRVLLGAEVPQPVQGSGQEGDDAANPGVQNEMTQPAQQEVKMVFPQKEGEPQSMGEGRKRSSPETKRVAGVPVTKGPMQQEDDQKVSDMPARAEETPEEGTSEVPVESDMKVTSSVSGLGELPRGRRPEKEERKPRSRRSRSRRTRRPKGGTGEDLGPESAKEAPQSTIQEVKPQPVRDGQAGQMVSGRSSGSGNGQTAVLPKGRSRSPCNARQKVQQGAGEKEVKEQAHTQKQEEGGMLCEKQQKEASKRSSSLKEVRDETRQGHVNEPTIDPPPQPQEVVKEVIGSDSTWTWMSGETELWEETCMYYPAKRHGWDEEIMHTLFLPSGSVRGPASAIVAQVPLLPSQLANVVVLKPVQSEVNATLVQVGMNALDRLGAKHGAGVPGFHTGQVVADELPGGSDRKYIIPKCGKTGWPVSKSKKDWQCPSVRCPNHTRLVFARRLVCPLCGAANPDQVPGGSEPAMDRACSTEVQKKRKLLETSDAQRKAARLEAFDNIQENDSSNEQVEVEEEQEEVKPLPKARPIFGGGWPKSRSTSESGLVAQSAKSSFTGSQRPAQYMPEGRDVFGCVVRDRYRASVLDLREHGRGRIEVSCCCNEGVDNAFLDAQDGGSYGRTDKWVKVVTENTFSQSRLCGAGTLLIGQGDEITSELKGLGVTFRSDFGQTIEPPLRTESGLDFDQDSGSAVVEERDIACGGNLDAGASVQNEVKTTLSLTVELIVQELKVSPGQSLSRSVRFQCACVLFLVCKWLFSVGARSIVSERFPVEGTLIGCEAVFFGGPRSSGRLTQVSAGFTAVSEVKQENLIRGRTCKMVHSIGFSGGSSCREGPVFPRSLVSQMDHDVVGAVVLDGDETFFPIRHATEDPELAGADGRQWRLLDWMGVFLRLEEVVSSVLFAPTVPFYARETGEAFAAGFGVPMPQEKIGGSDETAKGSAQKEGQMATVGSEQKTAEQKAAVCIVSLDGKVGQGQQTVRGFASIVLLSVAFEKFTQSNDEKLDRFTQTHQETFRRVETAGEERLKEMQELSSVSPKVRKVGKKHP